MRRLLFLILAAAAGPARAQQADSAAATLQVTLDEAIRRALDVQPAIIQARGAQRNAGAGQRSAFGAFLPTLTVNGSTARSGGQQLNQQTNEVARAALRTSFSGGLSASLVIFDGFARLASMNAASATANAADAGYVNQRFQVRLATKQVFYNALATEELVHVAEAQVRQARQQLDISVQKLHAGSATRSDSLRSVVDLGNANLALLQAQANLLTSQANLGRQIGVDQPVRALPDSALAPFPDTAALRQDAISHAPALTQAEAQASAARSQVTVARSQYFPTFSVGYSNGYNGSTIDTLLNSWSVRFTVSLPIFNGFTREQNLVLADVQRDVAVAQAADTRRLVGAQLTQEIAALQTSYTQIDIATANVAATTEDLRVQQERYRVGASTILDLLTSEASLTQAQTNLVQARFNYYIARAQLEALVGRTL